MADHDGAVNEILRACNLFPAEDAIADDPGYTVVSATQDFAQPTADMACHTRTPLRIGGTQYGRGLGVHANGHIVLDLTRPFQRFTAFVGVDNNSDTAGSKGSVVFIVTADGQERFRSVVRRGGDDPLAVDVDLDGVHRLELAVNASDDGISFDQADWADAVLVAATGESTQVSDAFAHPSTFNAPAASFRYGDELCWEIFKGWRVERAEPEQFAGGLRYRTTWTEPTTNFAATLTATVYEAPAGVELQWTLANGGGEPSDLVTDLRSIDLSASCAPNQCIVHGSTGGLTGGFLGRGEPTGFRLWQSPLGEKEMSVHGGRSSQGDLPFFVLENFSNGWSVVGGLGGSGQWRALGSYDSKQQTVSFRAGMEPCRFRVPPGETLALPAALLVPYRGTPDDGGNALRRVLRTRYQGHLNGEPVEPPVSYNSWFVFANDINEAMLMELADETARLGIEYFCVDAGWFEGAFPASVGDWNVAPAKFPNGLKPLVDYVHERGMKFGLWFEPERVGPDTPWQRDHPNLLLGGALLDFGNPEARTLVLDMMSGYIDGLGIDWIRFDSNIDPLDLWAQVEGPEEQGLRQLRHMNGLYAVWGELMRRHPGLLIEQCSSGGRRIDLDTIRYGHTFWKSDETYDQPLMRFHIAGGNAFLPGGLLNTNYCRYRSTDELLGLFGGPLGFGVDLRAVAQEDKDRIAQAVAAYKTVRRFINEVYYPLFPQEDGGDAWNGYQFMAYDGAEGFFVVYRPEASPYPEATVRLRALVPGQTYHLDNLLTGETIDVTGADLAQWPRTLAPGAAEAWHLRR